MVNFKPFLRLVRFPNFRLKIKLGGLLLCLLFLLNYQPSFSFPPVKKSIVYAEITQQPSVNSDSLPITFQLPHPGYLSTPFSSFHPGIDLASGLGIPIRPIAKGVVTSAGFNFWGLGLTVEVDHGSGYKSLYAHLGKIYLTVGKEVDENSFVGEVGLTGNTSGPHTHLEVSKDGVKIDPRLILPEIRSYPKEEDFISAQSATPSAVAIPLSTPSASNSAVVDLAPIPTPIPSLPETVSTTKDIISGADTEKTDLKQQNLDNILNLSTPKPSSTPLPQGGRISLKNFTLFGFKKN